MLYYHQKKLVKIKPECKNNDLAILYSRFVTLLLKNQKKRVMKKCKKNRKKNKKRTIKGRKRIFMSFTFVFRF